MSKVPSFGFLKPVLVVGLSALFIISSFWPTEGMSSVVTIYLSVSANENSTENVIYWSILYVVKTGEIAMAARPEEFQEPPQVPEYIKIIEPPPENFEWERFRFWGLSSHNICSDNYGPEWGKIDRGALIENYIFDTELGKVRKRTLNDVRIEVHVGICYNRKTGEIEYFYEDDNLFRLLGYGMMVELVKGFGFHLLDGYPEKIRNELTDTSTTVQFLKYIYDLKEHKVREATEAESRAIWEEWQRRAREAGAGRLPISIEPLPDNRIRATLQWSAYLMYIETNSSVLGVKFDSVNKQLYIEISGSAGIPGALNLVVPAGLIPSIADVKVYLDGQPLDFTLTQAGNYYIIHVEYTHSTRTLTVALTALPAWCTLPLNLALITLAIVAALGAVYWFKFRR